MAWYGRMVQLTHSTSTYIREILGEKEGQFFAERSISLRSQEELADTFDDQQDFLLGLLRPTVSGGPVEGGQKNGGKR